MAILLRMRFNDARFSIEATASSSMRASPAPVLNLPCCNLHTTNSLSLKPLWLFRTHQCNASKPSWISSSTACAKLSCSSCLICHPPLCQVICAVELLPQLCCSPGTHSYVHKKSIHRLFARDLCIDFP